MSGDERRPEGTPPSEWGRQEFFMLYIAIFTMFIIPGMLLFQFYECGQKICPYELPRAAYQYRLGDVAKELAHESVQVIHMQPGQRIDEVLGDRDKPLVLRGSIASTWKALSSWKPSYLSGHPDLRNMRRVKVSRQSVFYDNDAKAPLAKANIIPINDVHYKVTDMTGPEFFHAMNTTDDVLYWFGDLVHDSRALLDDVHPHGQLFLTNRDKKDEPLFLWLSSAGPKQWIHADSDHNIYTHVSGQKRWFLMPPSAYPNLYLYSRLHPMWHKSQVNLTDFSMVKFPLMANVPIAVVDLLPGDVLFVPEYWFHYVESVTPCVSIASWNEGHVWKPMKEITELAKGYDEVQDKALKMKAVASHIRTILSRLYNEDDAAAFVPRLLNQRWASLAHLFNVNAISAADCDTSRIPSSQRKFYLKDVDEIVANFKKIPGAVMDINVQDYIEMEALAAVQLNASEVYSYLTQCFPPASKPSDEL